jgi:hypothetical protein
MQLSPELLLRKNTEAKGSSGTKAMTPSDTRQLVDIKTQGEQHFSSYTQHYKPAALIVAKPKTLR